MLNERDGGIGGVKLVLEECETGYDTKKGVECYEAVKGKNPVVGQSVVDRHHPAADPARLRRQDPDPVHGLWPLGLGPRRHLPLGLQPAGHLLGRPSMIIKYIGEKEGGLDKLKGKKIGFIHLDASFGKEPIPLLQEPSKDRLRGGALSGRRPGHAEPVLAMAQRPPRPARLHGHVGLGLPERHRGEGGRRASAIPMDKFFSVWWPSEDDARGGGAGAKGFKMLNWHAVGTNFPAIQDIQKHVVDKGLSKAPKDKVGELLYNRGIYNSLLIAEGIRKAQKLTGKKAVTGEDVRRGMENIKLDPARLKELGLEGFTDPLALSCADHNGHRAAFMQEWDGTKWVKISDPIEPMTDRVKAQLDAAAKDYAEKNAGWPKRTRGLRQGELIGSAHCPRTRIDLRAERGSVFERRASPETEIDDRHEQRRSDAASCRPRPSSPSTTSRSCTTT